MRVSAAGNIDVQNSRAARVAVLGATGVVGQAMLGLLRNNGWEPHEVSALASEKSAETIVRADGDEWTVQDAATFDFSRADVVMSSVGRAAIHELRPRIMESGACLIDNSSAFRSDPAIPLVVPEINGHLLNPRPHLIASPNCNAIPIACVLASIQQVASVKRLDIATYQAVSGAGSLALAHFQSRSTKTDDTQRHEELIVDNVIPQIGDLDNEGWTDEELKVMDEVRKILDAPYLPMTVTCVRVPVAFGHSAALTIECSGGIPDVFVVEDAIRRSGIRVIESKSDGPPTPRTHAAGRKSVAVGRVRVSQDSEPRITLWVTSDNILKGAAWNLVQIGKRITGR